MQPPPFHVKQIDHIVLRIADLGKSLRFYRDSLGCTLEKEQPDIGLFQLRAGDSLIDLIPLNGQLGAAGGVVLEKKGTMSTIFACGLIPLIQRPCVLTCKPSAFPHDSKILHPAMVRTVNALRYTSRTQTGLSWS